MQNSRNIMTIILIISSAVMVVTGFFLLIDFDPKSIKHIHKYFGIAFIIAALWHGKFNIKPIQRCIKIKNIFIPLIIVTMIFAGSIVAHDMMHYMKRHDMYEYYR